MNPSLIKVTERIADRSRKLRLSYLSRMETQQQQPNRGGLSCGNLAHTVAAASAVEKSTILDTERCNVGIITAYNDMLSAHQPYAMYPQQIKHALSKIGHSAQVAGAVPAMCDGITQGQAGMDMSLFSRDLIAQATALSLSHNVFDAVLLLGICDKIAPGMLIGALSYGHLPCAFVPSGPMSTGISNDEKVIVRQQHAAGKVDHKALLEVECKAYHSAGTCTFYGTANSNQLIFEAMGLMLPGSAFIPPFAGLRASLTEKIAQHMPSISLKSENYRPLKDIIDERSLVNAMVALLASGGSSNHTIHLIAIAQAAGFIITWEDLDELSAIVPLLTRIYPNGPADINDFQQAGGVPTLLKELNARGLVHSDAKTNIGTLADHFMQPELDGANVRYQLAGDSTNTEVLAQPGQQFKAQGGLKLINGNVGRGIIKTSALTNPHLKLTAPVRVFQSQQAVLDACKQNQITDDCFIAVTYNGPASNGMPELHQLIPSLSNLMSKGLTVVLLTDGRLSGASGKVPAILHVTPEAATGGPIALLSDGDIMELDLAAGLLTCTSDLNTRRPQAKQSTDDRYGLGRELFDIYRKNVGPADQGASIFSQPV